MDIVSVTETSEWLFCLDFSADHNRDDSSDGMMPIKEGTGRMVEVWRTHSLDGVKVKIELQSGFYQPPGRKLESTKIFTG